MKLFGTFAVFAAVAAQGKIKDQSRQIEKYFIFR